MESHFTKILVYQDAFSESKKAIARALALAEKQDAKITVIDVVPPLSAFWDEFETDYWKTQEQTRKRRLIELVESFQNPDLFQPIEVLKGRVATQVIEKAILGKFDLVVKEATSKTADHFFGSIDLRLMCQCPLPTLFVNPNDPPRSHRILVAADPAAQDSEKVLNENLIYFASVMAKVEHSRLYLVGAWSSPYIADFSEEYIERYEKYQKSIKQKAMSNLKELAGKSLRPLKKPEDIILEDGAADDVILKAIERVKPDMLVIGSAARSGLSGFLLGNTAERVLRKVQCSVMIVKPPNFKSPIASQFA